MLQLLISEYFSLNVFYFFEKYKKEFLIEIVVHSFSKSHIPLIYSRLSASKLLNILLETYFSVSVLSLRRYDVSMYIP